MLQEQTEKKLVIIGRFKNRLDNYDRLISFYKNVKDERSVNQCLREQEMIRAMYQSLIDSITPKLKA